MMVVETARPRVTVVATVASVAMVATSVMVASVAMVAASAMVASVATVVVVMVVAAAAAATVVDVTVVAAAVPLKLAATKQAPRLRRLLKPRPRVPSLRIALGG